jgi:hypothetical protein
MKIEEGSKVKLLEHPCYSKQEFKFLRVVNGSALVANSRLGHIFHWPLNKLKEVK